MAKLDTLQNKPDTLAHSIQMKIRAIFPQEQPAQVFKLLKFPNEAEGSITLLPAKDKSSRIAQFANGTILMIKFKHMHAFTTPPIHINSIWKKKKEIM